MPRGGINGVKITFEECETGYATDKGVECYERLKGKNRRHGVPAAVHRHHLRADRQGAGRQDPADHLRLRPRDSADGMAFKWNFPLLGTYWTGADILMQHVAKKEGGADKLKGKKIALVYHDSPYGKEPIPLLQERSKMHGFDLQLLPVTAPGRRAEGHLAADPPERPDYVLLWGWGVMNSTALKEAVATGYPREKMYGVWWSGAEPDVKDVGAAPRATTRWRCSTAPSRTPRSSRTS
jgi:branched-chain amino acid transport system substrate-binding protein